MLNLNLKNVFYYSLIGLACNYMFLQDLSLLINRKKMILFILLSCLRNSMVLGEKNNCRPFDLNRHDIGTLPAPTRR